MARRRAVPAVLLSLLLAAGCTNGPFGKIEQPNQATTALPAADTSVVGGADAVALALATSQAIFQSAPAVVLVGADDAGALERAGALATQLGIPVLATPKAAPPVSTPEPTPTGTAGSTPARLAGGDAATDLRAEIDRLKVRAVVTVGSQAAAWAGGAGLPASITVSTGDDPAPRDVQRPAPLSSLTVLATKKGAAGPDAAAVATANAAGAHVLLLDTADPRATSANVQAITAETSLDHVLAVGSEFGSADQLRQRLSTAKTGVELPGGGQVLFPGRRLVAIYGHPGDTILGVLGEQDIDASVERAKQVAAPYDALFDEPVVPTFEIIVTVASGSAGSDGNYSNEFPVDKFRPWIEAAQQAGIYVVLDLQPGRTDFLTQAKKYQELLLEPNVGLALDPEWRMGPNQVPGGPIGHVSAQEINATGAWLAGLVRDHNLPQKVFILHWFFLSSIQNPKQVKTNYDELGMLIQMDGQGGAGQKRDTWAALHNNAPSGIRWGWKNFYDEDHPTFTPEETVATAVGAVYISYQ
ncbi:MAG TPA: hypothetical protein VH561_22820 [Micromonosporaceae bacterium]|jgi:hypothetical protein